VVRLSALLGDGHARVLAARGESILLDWIEGPTLASLPAIPADLIRRCGAMLGSLHAIDPSPAGVSGWDVSAIAARIEQTAMRLRRSDAAPAELLRRAVGAAERARPRSSSVGLVHQDFCGENLVLSGGRHPISIDDARLMVAPTISISRGPWYRWPMTRAERRQFASGYTERRPLESLLAHFDFWAVAALFGSLSSRLNSRLPLDLPVARLGPATARRRLPTIQITAWVAGALVSRAAAGSSGPSLDS
jgi:Ser/Thr protein kinase RdoA (MazF antagonist)